MQIAANPGGGLVSPGGPSMSSSSVTLRVRLFETPAAEIFDGGLEPLLTAIVNEPRFRLRSNLINERFLKKERKREGKRGAGETEVGLELVGGQKERSIRVREN